MDERLSTGLRSKLAKRTCPGVGAAGVDKIAAAYILQGYLDSLP